ncbi:hypothetical protein CBS147332_6349 [Penicillium roqueforti]|nr:hypothetical protein CBS147332_6349 [Penicillium roqueforti]KAI3098740.1 hypothetical protein CBS147331_8814 [Penicillium roqueforti]
MLICTRWPKSCGANPRNLSRNHRVKLNGRKPYIQAVRNQDWREDLKLLVYNPQPTILRKRSQSYRLVFEIAASDRHSSHAAGSGPPLPATPVFKLKTPRPDICVGLSDESLVNDLEPKKGRSAARSFLLDLQDTTSLVSDPHVTPLGLRFPFLIVEAKAGSTGGNLYQAQNQAAFGLQESRKFSGQY